MKCQWFGCREKAIVKITRADVCVCSEHYNANVLKFGCDLSFEDLPTPKDCLPDEEGEE